MSIFFFFFCQFFFLHADTDTDTERQLYYFHACNNRLFFFPKFQNQDNFYGPDIMAYYNLESQILDLQYVFFEKNLDN